MTIIKNSPRYRLLKQFPEMQEVVGTIFCEHEGWNCYGTTTGHFCTSWVKEEYFEPHVGEYFEKL